MCNSCTKLLGKKSVITNVSPVKLPTVRIIHTPSQDARQTLVDLIFRVGIVVKDCRNLQKLSNEELAEWISEQLVINGFSTTPVGSSWGTLN